METEIEMVIADHIIDDNQEGEHRRSVYTSITIFAAEADTYEAVASDRSVHHIYFEQL